MKDHIHLDGKTAFHNEPVNFLVLGKSREDVMSMRLERAPRVARHP